ncbi:MAG: adenosine kinase [Pseudomonadota bacterium]
MSETSPARYDIYGMGNALLDTEVEIDDAFLARLGIEKGMMTLVDAARQRELLAALTAHSPAHRRASGGSAANSIIAAQYFGSRTFFSCRVAHDEAGDFYLGDMEKAGVAVNRSARGNGVTGRCLVMITPDAERTMHTFLGISETLDRADLDDDAIRASHWTYLEGYLASSATGREAAMHARRIARTAGRRVAMTFSDPAMVQYFRDGLVTMLGDGVDLLFCNHVEAQLWTGTEKVEDAASLLKSAAGSFVITCGGDGALAWDGKDLHRIAATPVKPVDTNGAGDMFAGAFLHALNRGLDFPSAGRLASIAAARVVSNFGPRLQPAEHAGVLTAAGIRA